MIPEKDLEQALRQEGCSEAVIAHCRKVRDVALRYAVSPDVDRELVATGALLHDIGRGETHTIGHGQAGADICRRRGYPESVARIVERHVGAGLTAEECAENNLELRNCIPETREEKCVAHADNLVKGTEEITIEERIALSSSLPEKTKERILRLAREVEAYIP